MWRDCRRLACLAFLCLLGCPSVEAADWMQFRGPGGLGTSGETGLPVEWSSHKNIVWKTNLPGPGTSCPVTVADRIFLTCYTGYALEAANPGKMEDLRRHIVCVQKQGGKILWKKEFKPRLPEHKYVGEGSYHGYSSSTPVSDGERLYVFFGKSGVYCFDLDGKELWHVSVGDKIDRWGSAASPILYKNLLIVNASIENNAIVALDKLTGKEIWRAPGVRRAWDTPLLTVARPHDAELVVSMQERILAFNPDSGKPLWNADGVHRYVCPSVVAGGGVIYAIGGGHTSLVVQSGGGSNAGRMSRLPCIWTDFCSGQVKKVAWSIARTSKRATSSIASVSIPRRT
jgi:outer membrane protein assembly factor BamB